MGKSNKQLNYVLKIYYSIRFFLILKLEDVKIENRVDRKWIQSVYLSTYPLDSRALTFTETFRWRKEKFLL